TYGVELNLYTENSDGKMVKVHPLDAIREITSGSGSSFAGGSLMSLSNTDVWQELVENSELLELQYDTVYGRWPENYNEAVLFVDENNEINDYILCGLGVIDQDLSYDLLSSDVAGIKFANDEVTRYSYEDLCGISFRLVPASLKYSYNEAAGVWEDRGDDASYMKWVCDNLADEIKIVGIMRPNETAAATSLSAGIGYTHALTEHCIAVSNASEVVKQQKSTEINAAATAKYGKEYRDCDVDVFTGIPFDYVAGQRTVTIEDVRAYIAMLPETQRAMVESMTQMMSEQQLVAYFAKYIEANDKSTKATYKGNLQKLGAAELDVPTGISIYAKDFESKDFITAFIEEYNAKMTAEGHEDKTIKYTDFIGTFLSSVSTIINTISYVLIAFVAISLVGSSIMIGVITYISVLERTKEIGILRSIGASRRDVARVFNAETLIVGFASGIIGILLTVLLNIPINIIIYSLSKIPGFAFLPWLGGLILVAISMLLTLVAGLIPSRLAARKDPVVALRTE
ncbi:MAG: ABC transporter permease, partial [Clostridia bacterium]|nr:ABC transporter permease [Clostridia bacterium]